MAVFLISYDLRKPDFDYDPLYDALGEIGAKHVQDSVWGVRTTKSAESIFDALWQHMHNDKDRLPMRERERERDYAEQVNRLAEKVQQNQKRSTAALRRAEAAVKHSQAARKKALERVAQLDKASLPEN